jgi:hypothetical protein
MHIYYRSSDRKYAPSLLLLFIVTLLAIPIPTA